MRKALKLCHIYLSGIFSIHSFFEEFKGGGKKVAKNIAFIFLFLYCIVVFGGMFVFVLNSLYSGLKPLGLQSLVLAITAFMSVLVTLFFGFINATGTYVSNTNEEFLLSMPLSPQQLFSAKFLQTYVLEFAFGFAILCIGSFVYAIGEGLLASPMFYISLLLAGVFLPLIPVSITYIILVCIFNMGKSVVNKRILTIISTILLMIIILGFNFLYQRMMQNFSDAEVLVNLIQSEGFNTVISVLKFFPPVAWYVEAVSSSSIFKALLLTLVPALIASAVIYFLSPLYIRSIIGFSETNTKKLSKKKSAENIQKDIVSTSLFKTLLKRDILAVFREPTFFVNGPLLVVLLPVILLISFAFSLPEDAMQKIPDVVSSLMAQFSSMQGGVETETLMQTILFAISSICALFSVLLGTMVNISSTAFSREGKALFNLKAMPIPIKTLFSAKMMHAMLYVVFTTIISLAVIVAFFVLIPFSFTPVQIALTLIGFIALSITLSFLLLLFGMSTDLSHPKLNWENPTAAFKQNINAVGAVFLSMGVVVVLVICGIFFVPKKLVSVICISFVLLVIDIISWKLFIRSAQKRWFRIE